MLYSALHAQSATLRGSLQRLTSPSTIRYANLYAALQHLRMLGNAIPRSATFFDALQPSDRYQHQQHNS